MRQVQKALVCILSPLIDHQRLVENVNIIEVTQRFLSICTAIYSRSIDYDVP